MAVKLIIRKKQAYEENIKEPKLPTLKERRNALSLNFAKDCISNEKTKNLFIKNKQTHKNETQNQRKISN